LTPESNEKILFEILDSDQQATIKEHRDFDKAYALEGVGRFRCNLFYQQRGIGAVFRIIPATILTVDQLNLPDVVRSFADYQRGMVLVTGPTGSGKSTTMAAIIDLINDTHAKHIITIEDPLEFVHPNKKCIFSQREIGSHALSFGKALSVANREDPDIILVGEMRDLETIALAMEAAMTGHVVFGTLHTMNAMKTVDRIIEIFPADQQGQVRSTLADALKAVVSQTLFKRIDKKGRCAAQEILICTPAVRNLIREAKTYQIPSAMQTGKKYGMATLDDTIEELLKRRMISADDAYINCIEKKRFLGYMKKPPTDFTDA
ncbi:MAG: PilT/PilU family type 4a pilus ATPase, partial [Candidatus Electrothrix sp. AUS4]|nr:PilT/PilU family type 4a pilus ATPase [Candidatus Electrothrix sp. AUS4]